MRDTFKDFDQWLRERFDQWLLSNDGEPEIASLNARLRQQNPEVVNL